MNEKSKQAVQRVAAIKERAQYAPDLRETVCELVELVQELIEAAATQPAPAPAARTTKTSK